MSTPTAERTIAEQVRGFTPGFEEQIGGENAAAFASEQADLHAATPPAGLPLVGDALPGATLLTAAGDEVALDDVLGGRTGVLVFYRGAWCPYCNIALRTYQRDLLPELERRGAVLVAISPQTPSGSQAAGENWELDFAVLSDPGNTLAHRLGIVTRPSDAAQRAQGRLGLVVAEHNADGTADIPFPTVLVVDAEGVVRFADVHLDYTTRTEVTEILSAVDAL